jgi:hypothetical protein
MALLKAFAAIFALLQQTPTFTADANLVPIEAYVTDRVTGRPISGLTSSDFVVLEEGQTTRIVAFDAGSRSIISQKQPDYMTPWQKRRKCFRAAGIPGREGMLVITHNREKGSKQTAATVLSVLLESDTIVSAVIIPQEVFSKSLSTNSAVL